MLGKVSFLIYNVIGGELMLLALSVHYARDVLNDAVHGAANDLTGRNMLGAIGKSELMLCLKSLNSKLSVLRGDERKSKVRWGRENDNEGQIERGEGARQLAAGCTRLRGRVDYGVQKRSRRQRQRQARGCGGLKSKRFRAEGLPREQQSYTRLQQDIIGKQPSNEEIIRAYSEEINALKALLQETSRLVVIARPPQTMGRR